MGVLLSTQPQPQPPPIIPPPAPPPPAQKKPPPPPKPDEQRCYACINYHLHDHPSIIPEGANFQTFFYPAESPREKFEGIIIKGLPEWYGRLTFKSKAAYEGGFRAGEFNGFGHYVVEGTYEYLGGYTDGKKEGYGREIIVKEGGVREEYLGGWKEDVKHGEGLKDGREWLRFYLGQQLQSILY